MRRPRLPHIRQNRKHLTRLNEKHNRRSAFVLGIDGSTHVCGDIDHPFPSTICGRGISANPLPADRPDWPPRCPTCKTRRSRSLQGLPQT